MKVKFLLDEHISPKVVEQLSHRDVDVRAVDGSDLDGLSDAEIFEAAIREGRIVVTYNNADFAALLSGAINAGRTIPGMVFVSGQCIPTSDLGGLVTALEKLAKLLEAGRLEASGGLFLTR